MASVTTLYDSAGKVRGYKVRWWTSAGQPRSKTFPLKAKGRADEFAVRVEADKLGGTELDRRGERLTVDDYAAGWLAVLSHREGSAARVEDALILFRQMFGDRQIRRIRQSDVKGWAKTRRGQVGAGTLRTDFTWVRGLFKAAVADRILLASPCDGVKLEAATRRQIVVPGPDGVLAIAERLPASWGFVAVLGARSGLRPGELLGLCVEQVDFLRFTVTVDRQLSRAGVKLEPKTASSARTVPLDAETVHLLSAHLAANPPGPPVPMLERVGNRLQPAGEGRLVFHRADGSPVGHEAVNQTWRRQAARVGLAGVRLHDMRHFYATQGLAAGLSIVEVSKLLGHSAPSITADIYGHVTDDHEERVRESIAKVWRSRRASSTRPGGAVGGR